MIHVEYPLSQVIWTEVVTAAKKALRIIRRRRDTFVIEYESRAEFESQLSRFTKGVSFRIL